MNNLLAGIAADELDGLDKMGISRMLIAMFETCLEKQQAVKELFAACKDLEARYEKIIELGRLQPPLDAKYKVADNLVKGCQSQMYLHAYLRDGLVIFEGESDALISEGLAALLILVYSGEAPETILKCPPAYIDELQITASLTQNRANGLYSMHLRMKQEALKLLMQAPKPSQELPQKIISPNE